ncbi:MAG: IS630 family transposase [Nevskiales bacterium]
MRSKSDARKLDIATQTQLRRSVVQAVRGGMSQTRAAEVFGPSLRAVSKWMALDRAGGLRALKPKRRGRRAGEGRLDRAQSARIRQLIVDSLPDQLKLLFYLWTRAAVVSLIEREYGVSVSLTTVGRYLHGWGMSPQKPVRRAYERNAAAIARWLHTEYPALARDAKREKAAIYWGDEMGLRSDHVAGTSYAPLGRTPLIRATGQRFGCNMISAITNRGQLAFMVFHGQFDARLFIRFMQRLLKQVPGKLYLIVDGHPVHRSVVARDFVSANTARLRLIRLPGYCPELNPDELLNQDVKTNGLGKSRPTNRAEMMAGVRGHLRRRQRQPQIIRNFFQEKHVRYAA